MLGFPYALKHLKGNGRFKFSELVTVEEEKKLIVQVLYTITYGPFLAFLPDNFKGALTYIGYIVFGETEEL
jgi:hypothetical protein